MAKKTFISYKYSEARDVRDKIIDALGDCPFRSPQYLFYLTNQENRSYLQYE